MTPATRRAIHVAASLAAVGTLAACGGGQGAAGADAPAESSADGGATGSAAPDDAASEGTDGESPDVAVDGSGTYADGSYTATGSYVSPGGEESVEVTLTLDSGVVSEVDVVSLAQHPNSVRFQGEFISGISDVVVGVPIDELAVDKVAGSSLTSGGFNEAVDLIKEEARA